MSDWTFVNLTTAVVGVATTVNFQVQSTSPYTQTVTNGTISLGNVSASNFNILSDTTPSHSCKKTWNGSGLSKRCLQQIRV